MGNKSSLLLRPEEIAQVQEETGCKYEESRKLYFTKTRFLHNNLQGSILSMEQLFYDVDFLVCVCVCVPRQFPFIRHNCLLTLLIIIEKYFYWPYIVYCHCVWNGCGC